MLTVQCCGDTPKCNAASNMRAHVCTQHTTLRHGGAHSWSRAVYPTVPHRVPHGPTPCTPRSHTMYPTVTHRVPHGPTPCTPRLHTVYPTVPHRVPHGHTPCTPRSHTVYPMVTHRVTHGHTPCTPRSHTVYPMVPHRVPHGPTPCTPRSRAVYPRVKPLYPTFPPAAARAWQHPLSRHALAPAAGRHRASRRGRQRSIRLWRTLSRRNAGVPPAGQAASRRLPCVEARLRRLTTTALLTRPEFPEPAGAHWDTVRTLLGHGRCPKGVRGTPATVSTAIQLSPGWPANDPACSTWNSQHSVLQIQPKYQNRREARRFQT